MTAKEKLEIYRAQTHEQEFDDSDFEFSERCLTSGFGFKTPKGNLKFSATAHMKLERIKAPPPKREWTGANDPFIKAAEQAISRGGDIFEDTLHSRLVPDYWEGEAEVTVKLCPFFADDNADQ